MTTRSGRGRGLTPATSSGPDPGQGGSGLGLVRRVLPTSPPHPLRKLALSPAFIRGKLSTKQGEDLTVMMAAGDYVMLVLNFLTNLV